MATSAPKFIHSSGTRTIVLQRTCPLQPCKVMTVKVGRSVAASDLSRQLGLHQFTITNIFPSLKLLRLLDKRVDEASA